MAQPTYASDVVVLRKTKLGEADLILTCLAADGSQVRLVAKGARKPSSTFSSRLEIFAHAHLLIARGRSLDIVKEAELLDGFDALRTCPEKAAAASVLCEFLGKVTEEGLEVPRLYEMTLAALGAMGAACADKAPMLASAALLKGFAFCGLRPELSSCIGCGTAMDLNAEAGNVWFSYTEGGIVCSACMGGLDCVALDANLLRWLWTGLHRTFAEIAELDPQQASFDCLQFCQQWCRVHIGAPLKSIDFLLVNPLSY